MEQQFDEKTGEVYTVETSEAYRRPLNIKTNWTRNPLDGEVNYGVSETIPDQSLTVRELFRRHVRGLPIQGERVGSYDYDEQEQPIGDGESRDIRTMDFTEIQEELNEIRQKEYEKRKQYWEEKKEKRKKDEETYWENHFKAKQDKKPNIDPKVLGTIPTEADQGTKDQSGPKP